MSVALIAKTARQNVRAGFQYGISRNLGFFVMR